MRFFKWLLILFLSVVFLGCDSGREGAQISPADSVIYLRGTMNNWGTDNPFTTGEGNYILLMQLNEGKYELKIADSNWSSVNYGTSRDDNSLPLNQPKVLVAGGGNVLLALDSAGSYLFNVKLSDKERPTILVTKVNLVEPF